MDYCFDKFEKRLKKELAEYPKLITEDLLRHWYIVANENIANAVIEYPYRKLIDTDRWFKSNRVRIDLCYIQNNTLNTAFEFKFHKKVETASCETDNFGQIFNDLNRLSLLDCSDRLLIYVYDEEMFKYYNNCHAPLIGETSEFSSKDIFEKYQMKTFCDSAYRGIKENVKSTFNYRIKVVYSCELPRGFHLQIYKVQNQ